MIRLSLPWIAPALLLCGTGAGYADWTGILATPGSMWEAALDHSDMLSASQLTAESASSMHSSAGRLPDPTIRMGWAPSPLETRNGPVEFTATLVQRIPWPGELSGSRLETGYREELARIRYEVASLEMRTALTALWAEMYVIRGSIELLENELERLDHLAAVAGVRYRSGQTGLAALLLLENRTATVGSRLYGSRLDLDAVEAEAASLIGLPSAGFVWPDSLPGIDSFLEDTAVVVPPEESPSVRMSTAAMDISRASLAHSRGMLYPDLELGATWSGVGEPAVAMGAVDPGKDALMVFAGLSLPLGYSGARDASRAAELSSEAAAYALMQAVSDQTARRLELRSKLDGLVNMHVSYTGTVLPNAEAIYELTTADWIAGLATMEEVIASLDDLEDARLEELRLYAGAVNAYAGLLENEGRSTEKGEFL